jgi:hypothetical protein
MAPFTANQCEAVRTIADVRCPVMVVRGVLDEVISSTQGHKPCMLRPASSSV